MSNIDEVILEEEADLILYLLEHGCDSTEETAKLLCVACSYGNLTLVKTLVEQFGTDPKGITLGNQSLRHTVHMNAYR